MKIQQKEKAFIQGAVYGKAHENAFNDAVKAAKANGHDKVYKVNGVWTHHKPSEVDSAYLSDQFKW